MNVSDLYLGRPDFHWCKVKMLIEAFSISADGYVICFINMAQLCLYRALVHSFNFGIIEKRGSLLQREISQGLMNRTTKHYACWFVADQVLFIKALMEIELWKPLLHLRQVFFWTESLYELTSDFLHHIEHGSFLEQYSFPIGKLQLLPFLQSSIQVMSLSWMIASTVAVRGS